MIGKFILSFDCEGKWGIADNLTGVNNKISDQSLDYAYNFIFNLLEKYDIKASFAFTSLFSVSEEIIQSFKLEITEMSQMGYDWYIPIVQMINNNSYDGWIGEKFFKRAIRHGHEIGWHGFSHHTLGENINPVVIDFEIENGIKVADAHGVNISSLIFPRNQVGNLKKLKEAGFTHYRMAKHQIDKKYISPRFRLLNEFNIFDKSQFKNYDNTDTLTAVAPGEFLNWPNGARSLVPDTITIARWKSILRDASKTGGVAHLWLHPHNLITAPRMMRLLEIAIKEASMMIKENNLKNVCFNDIN